jgi:DNA invertase Pin-like site-specific DNA recombinase
MTQEFKKNQKKAFVYIRISTEMQKEKDTQKTQKSAIDNFMKKNEYENIQILERFEDLAISGAKANRKCFNIMLSRIKEVNCIIVYDLSRLSRDMEISLDLMKLLMLNKIEIIEVYSNKIIDVNDDNDQLQYLLSSWFSSVERKKIKARQKAGILRFRSEKKYWGREKSKKFLDLVKYKKLKEEGKNNRQIADNLEISESTLYRRMKELRKLEINENA